MRLPIRLRLGASPRRVRDVLLELIRLSMLVTGEPILNRVEGVEIEGLLALSEVEGFVVIWLLMRDVLMELCNRRMGLLRKVVLLVCRPDTTL
jgi:hypothetical protein